MSLALHKSVLVLQWIFVSKKVTKRSHLKCFSFQVFQSFIRSFISLFCLMVATFWHFVPNLPSLRSLSMSIRSRSNKRSSTFPPFWALALGSGPYYSMQRTFRFTIGAFMVVWSNIWNFLNATFAKHFKLVNIATNMKQRESKSLKCGGFLQYSQHKTISYNAYPLSPLSKHRLGNHHWMVCWKWSKSLNQLGTFNFSDRQKKDISPGLGRDSHTQPAWCCWTSTTKKR